MINNLLLLHPTCVGLLDLVLAAWTPFYWPHPAWTPFYLPHPGWTLFYGHLFIDRMDILLLISLTSCFGLLDLVLTLWTPFYWPREHWTPFSWHMGTLLLILWTFYWPCGNMDILLVIELTSCYRTHGPCNGRVDTIVMVSWTPSSFPLLTSSNQAIGHLGAYDTMFLAICVQYCTLWHHVLDHVCTVHFDTMFWSMCVLYTLTPCSGPCLYCTLWLLVLVCTVHFNTMFWTMCVLYTLTPCFWTMCVLYTLTPCSGPCVYCTLWHHVLVHVCTVHFNTIFCSMSVLYTFFFQLPEHFTICQQSVVATFLLTFLTE